jgi:hypothetical protein
MILIGVKKALPKVTRGRWSVGACVSATSLRADTSKIDVLAIGYHIHGWVLWLSNAMESREKSARANCEIFESGPFTPTHPTACSDSALTYQRR